MTVRPAAGAILLAVTWSVSAACSGRGDASADSALNEVAASPVTDLRPDRTAVRAAEAALLQWLDRSRETNAGPGAMPVGNDPACDDGGGSWFPATLLADSILWDVIPADDGAWAVSNGLRFGYRGSDSLTVWRPDGSSYQTARALADSIVRAHQSAPASSSPP